MTRELNLSCLMTRKTIHIRVSKSDSLYYFEMNGKLYGFIKPYPSGWYWHYNGHVKRYRTLSLLLEDAKVEIT